MKLDIFRRNKPKNGKKSRTRKNSDTRMEPNVPPVAPAPETEAVPVATPRQEARGYTEEELNAIAAAIGQAVAQVQAELQAQNAANSAQPEQPATPEQPEQSATPEQSEQTGEPEPTPAPEDEDDYETAEEQRRQAEERINAANEAVDKAKATVEEEKDKVKRAKEAVKEAKKAASKAKWDAFKAKHVLIRKPKGGIITSAKKHWKKITACALTLGMLGGGAWAIKHGIINIDLGGKDNRPSTEQVDPTETPNPTTTPATPEQIETVVEGIQENLDAVDENLENLDMAEGYTAEDATELVKFLNGQESTLSVDQANEMLENIVSSVLTPAINNALVGEKVYETQGINIASILANDPAYKAVQDMEDYINGSIEHPEQLSDYARNSLEDQVRIINIGETVNGFNIATASPAARLVWANLAAGMNGLAGTKGEDFTVEVNGTTYAQNEINNGTILQMVINGAKQDLGLSAKTMDQK